MIAISEAIFFFHVIGCSYALLFGDIVQGRVLSEYGDLLILTAFLSLPATRLFDRRSSIRQGFNTDLYSPFSAFSFLFASSISANGGETFLNLLLFFISCSVMITTLFYSIRKTLKELKR